MSDTDLKGRCALVCGASKGIGFAIASELARRGCRVIGLARQASVLSDALRTLKGDGHVGFAVDLSDREALKTFLTRDLPKGAVDILINNSGGPPSGPLLASDSAAFLSVFEQHVLSAHVLVQALVPRMKEKGFGRIVNIISTSVKVPIPGLGVSNTIRGAMANWSKTLSIEVGAFGITVNNVLPGFTQTERLQGLKASMARAKNVSESDIEREWIESVPLKRLGQPEEIANAVSFLVSPSAGYITGTNVVVDGGRTGCL